MTYVPVVKYRYRVDEVDHSGERIFFGDRVTTNLECHALSISNRYKVGDIVSVRVNPEDSALGVLEPGPHIENWGEFLLFAAFLGLGVYELSVGLTH